MRKIKQKTKQYKQRKTKELIEKNGNVESKIIIPDKENNKQKDYERRSNDAIVEVKKEKLITTRTNWTSISIGMENNKNIHRYNIPSSSYANFTWWNGIGGRY